MDDKPEVKKAGGVYYTPTYIVDYIVRQTAGKLLDEAMGGAGVSPAAVGALAGGSSPAAEGLREGAQPGTRDARAPLQARAATAILNRVAKLRILDPACGSGSFLIGAYQFLLDWHLQFYLDNNPAKWAGEIRGKHPVLVQSRTGGWQLSIAERKRILLANIYGVDIDPQAVEVTKLSLLLKVLEGESAQAQTCFALKDRVLPDLGANIKCGNSLIGPDFYQQAELPLLTDEECYRINVFDWPAEFAQILQRHAPAGELRETATADHDYTMPGVPLHGSYATKKPKGGKAANAPAPIASEWEGGFDAVIGNPPYVRIQTLRDSQPQEVEFFGRAYQAAGRGNYDLYVVFVERGLQLLNTSGRLGFIVPNKFFRTDYGQGLRRALSDRKALSRIVDFGPSQVFAATTHTCLLFLQARKADSFEYAQSEASAKSLALAVAARRDTQSLSTEAWAFDNAETELLRAKLARRATRLLDLPSEMSRGSSTGDDEVFVFESGTLKVEKEIVREPVFASDFGRYRFAPSGKWRVIFPCVSEDGEFRLYTEQELKQRFPRAYAHLHRHQQALKRRKQFKEWFGYSAPRNLALHDRAQIAVPLLADGGMFARIPEKTHGRLCPMAGGGFTITLSSQCQVKPEYVLGLLNSRLLFWRLRGASNLFRGGWITCTKQYFGGLPIRTIDFADKTDRTAHDRMVKLVEQMLELHKKLAAARTPQEQTALERQIAAADAQIDRLVYDLYGLTEGEIRIVEGKAGAAPGASSGPRLTQAPRVANQLAQPAPAQGAVLPPPPGGHAAAGA